MTVTRAMQAESDLATQVADTWHFIEGATPLSLEDISETVDGDTADTLETVPAAAEPSSSSKTSDSLVSFIVMIPLHPFGSVPRKVRNISLLLTAY